MAIKFVLNCPLVERHIIFIIYLQENTFTFNQEKLFDSSGNYTKSNAVLKLHLQYTYIAAVIGRRLLPPTKDPRGSGSLHDEAATLAPGARDFGFLTGSRLLPAALTTRRQRQLQGACDALLRQHGVPTGSHGEEAEHASRLSETSPP